MLALSLPVLAFAAGLLLFGVIVVARFALGLMKEARALATHARAATGRLSEALEEVSVEGGKASRTIDHLEQVRAARRRRGKAQAV